MYILIDIGGTNTRIAKTTDKQMFDEPVIFPTQQNFDEWVNQATTIINTLRGDSSLSAIVIGIPATFKDGNSIIFTAPNLPNWQGIKIKEKLQDLFSCEVVIENDTALVGLGEAIFGGGKGYDIVAYLTISTGVNGVRITDGTIDKNKFGYEIGHHIVNDNKDIEYYISGKSLETRFGMPSKENKNPELWKEVDYYTGIFVANTIMYWSPAVIVFGGPVMNDINLENVLATTKKFTTRYEVLPIFTRGTLGSLGGIYGGLAMVQKMFK